MSWDAVEADFQRFYGLDLRQECHTAGLRRLFTLIEYLPSEAAVWREPRPSKQPISDSTEIAKWFGKHIQN